MVAKVNPKLRVRFSTSHPKDMTDDVLHMMAKYDNICKYIHLPVQSGNTEILKKMNRGYTRECYDNRISAIRRIMTDSAISTDIITGFCTETEEQHQDTIDLVKQVRYDYAYMFFYSERPKTLAERKYEDDIPLEVKKRRLAEVIKVQNENSLFRLSHFVGQTQEILIEGPSRKFPDSQLCGRNTQNAMVIIDKGELTKGTYVNVLIESCTGATVFGKVDVVYVDIAQPDQTQIAIDNCEMFLKKGGYFFLVIKTRSIDVTKAPKRIVEEEIEKLKPRFEVLQTIDLHPYDKDHAMVISKFNH